MLVHIALQDRPRSERPISYRHELIAFISVHAEALKVFVEQAFHNPVLVRIIDIISKFGAVQ